MFHYAVDGNFQSTQKMKPMDLTDFSLTNGAGYFVEQNDFKQFRDAVRPPKKFDQSYMPPRLRVCRQGSRMGVGKIGIK